MRITEEYINKVKRNFASLNVKDDSNGNYSELSITKPLSVLDKKISLEAFRKHNFELIFELKEVYEEFSMQERKFLFNNMLSKLNQMFIELESGNLLIEDDIHDVLNHLNALQMLPH